MRDIWSKQFKLDLIIWFTAWTLGMIVYKPVVLLGMPSVFRLVFGYHSNIIFQKEYSLYGRFKRPIVLTENLNEFGWINIRFSNRRYLCFAFFGDEHIALVIPMFGRALVRFDEIVSVSKKSRKRAEVQHSSLILRTPFDIPQNFAQVLINQSDRKDRDNNVTSPKSNLPSIEPS